MKKYHLFSRIIAALVLITILTFANTSTAVSKAYTDFYNDHRIQRFDATVPFSLIRIEDEAFSGTKLRNILLNTQVEYIGNAAFGNNDNLQDVFIYERTSYIGFEAFSKKTIIHGIEGSYAQQWSEKNGYSFIIDNTRKYSISGSLISVLYLYSQFCFFGFDVDTCEYRRKRVRAYVKNMRPKERVELYPIDYRFP